MQTAILEIQTATRILPRLLATLVGICLLPVVHMAAQEPDSEEARERMTMGRFLTILETNPRRGTTLDRIYGYHIERGTLDSLIKSYRERTANRGEAGKAWMIVGLLESLRGQDAASVHAFAQAEQLDPANWLAPYYRGQSLMLVGQPEQATVAFEAAIVRKPPRADLLEVFEALGRVHQRAQQPEQAMLVWNRLEKLFPNDARVQEQIATTLLDEGEFAAALPRFEQLIELTKDKYRQSLFQIEAAEIKVRLGRRDDGLRDFEQLLSRLNPDNWLYREVRKRVENMFLRSDDQAGLIAYYESWVKQHPEDLDAISRLAWLLTGLGRQQESQAWLARGLKAAPSKTSLRRALISQLVYEQKYAEAIVQYEQMDKYEPNNTDTLREWGRLVLKDATRDEGTRREAASAIWRRLIVARPKDPLVISQVAELYRQSDMVDQALDLYRAAVDLAPEQAQYKEYLGEYYHSLQRKDEALATWRLIASGRSRTAANVARLAEVLAGFGYLSEAIDTNAEACKLDPKEINLQIKHADFLSQAERHAEALTQLAVVQKLVANDAEREAWLGRELKELQSIDGLQKRIEEVRISIGSTADPGPTDDSARHKLADQWFWLARAHEVERQWKQAGEAVTKATELAPQSMPILTASARIMEAQSNLLVAAQIYTRLATVDRRFRTEYLQKVARLETMLGRRDQALQAGRDVIAAAPGNPDVYEFFATLCFQLGEAEEGLQALRRAVRVAPGNLKGLMLLATALAEQFRTDEAIELYWRAFEKSANTEDRLSVVPRLAELYLQTNQFDRLLERLEHQRRELNLQREMTLCLAQAHQSVGDDGSARQELEKLLTEETRDSQLLMQLVKLCEADGDLEAAIRYQQQLNRVVPGKDGPLRLAQLLQKEGEIEEATTLLVQIATEEKDFGRVIRAIDSLLSADQDEQALRVLQKSLREQPKNWELLYRQAVIYADEKPDEATRIFQAILELDLNDDAVASGSKQTPTSPPAQALWSGVNFQRRPLTERDSQSGGIQGVMRRNSRFQPHQAWKWLPADFGQARMASWAWLGSLAEERGGADDFDRRKEMLTQSGRMRDLIDAYYLACFQNNDEQYKVLKLLSQRSDADHEMHELYLNSLSSRGAQEEVDSGEAPADEPMSGDSKEDDPAEEKLIPLARNELDHVIKIASQLRQAAVSAEESQLYLKLMIAELKRSGHKDEVEKLLADAVAAAKSAVEISAVLEEVKERRDHETARTLIDRLAELAEQQNTRRWNNAASRPQPELSTDHFARQLAWLMAHQVVRNKADKADDPLAGIMDLWKRYLNRMKVKTGSSGPAIQHRPYFELWNSTGEASGVSVMLPPHNNVTDWTSVQLLYQMFELYRECEQPKGLIDAFTAAQADPQTPPAQRLYWRLGLGYLQWWNGDEAEAIISLAEAADAMEDNVMFKLSLAGLYEKQKKFDLALQFIDAISPTDQISMREREVMALRLSVQSANVARARTAASRLFGLRLETNLQMALARQMHQLGMHQQAEAVLARAARQAGNKTEVLRSLMEQYSAANNLDVAGQIAYQLLRRTRSPVLPGHSAHLHFHHGWHDERTEIRTQALHILNRSGRLAEMIGRIETQLKTSPKSLRLLESLREYYAASDNDTQVQQVDQRLEAVRIEDPRIRLEVALKLLNSGKFKEASEHLNIVVRANPRLVADASSSILNGYLQHQHRQLAEFATLMESIEPTAFRKDLSQLTSAIRWLLNEKETRDRALEMFRKAWQALPDARHQLLVSMTDSEFWQLPEAMDYVRQGIIPSERDVQKFRWNGLGNEVSHSSEGTIETTWLRILDLAEGQDKLELLSDEINNAVRRMPDWTSGKLMIAMIDLRRGRVDAGRDALQGLVPVIPKNNQGILRELGQELMAHEACIDLAIRCFELSIAAEAQSSSGWDCSRLLVKLYKEQGRGKDARTLLLRMVKPPNNADPLREDTDVLRPAPEIGHDLVQLGYHADAIRLFHRVLSVEGEIRFWIDKEKFEQLRLDLATATAKLKAESIVELLTPAPRPRPNPRSPGSPRPPIELDEGKTPSIDLQLRINSENHRQGTLGQTRMSSPLLDLIGVIGTNPDQLPEADAAIEDVKRTRPDDVGAAILAAHLAIVSHREPLSRSRVDELVALTNRFPLGAIPDKGTPSEKQQLTAMRQVPLWLIARSCLQNDPLREAGQTLAVRALAAARQQPDNKYSLAILHEWGMLALEAGDKTAAARLWTERLEQVIPKPRRPNVAVPDEFRQIDTIEQLRQALQIARWAADHGLIELSQTSIIQALHGGPPLLCLQDPGGNNPFGQQQLFMNQYDSESIHSTLQSLTNLWRRNGVTDEQIYVLLRGVVFPSVATQELFLYPVPLSDGGNQSPKSVSTLWVKIAIRAKKTEELKGLAEQRLQQPFGEFPARILLTQLALATHDAADARQHLSLLAERLKQDSLAETSDLVCHVAIPAMSVPELQPLAAKLIAHVLENSRATDSRGQRHSIPSTSLTFLLARNHLQNGRSVDALKLLESWISVQGSHNARFGGSYEVQYRKQAYLRVAGELAANGFFPKSLELLDRISDLVTNHGDTHSVDEERRILIGLASLGAAERYELLKDWTLPARGRTAVRSLTGLIPADRGPATFDAVRGAKPRGPRTARLTSSLELLIDSARELNKLKQLQAEFEPHAASSDGNANALAMIQIANGQASKSLELLKSLNSIPKKPAEGEYRRRPTDTFAVEAAWLAKSALGDPDPQIREQGWTLAHRLCGRQTYYYEGRDVTRHMLQSAFGGPQIANEWDKRLWETGLKHWVAGSTLTSGDERLGLPSWWHVHEGLVTHHRGSVGRDDLYFAYPLQGHFELICEVAGRDYSIGSLVYGGIAVSRNRPDNPMVNAFGFNKMKLIVKGNKVTGVINGHPIDIDRQVGVTSPFIALRSQQHANLAFRNVQITGSPVVPREVPMISEDCLLGWASDFYQESQPAISPPQDSARHTDDDEALPSDDDYDWYAKNGEILGRVNAPLGSPILQSCLRYGRPLRDRETVKFEFWHEPGDDGFHTHPALDRLAFLLDSDGVRLHWMTVPDNRQDDANLPPDNAIVEENCRRGPARLPLRVNDWNRVELTLADGSVHITLNETLIYERPLEHDNLRQFGLYHDKSRQAVRVRNVVLTGDWPKSLESVSNDLLEPIHPPTVHERRMLAGVVDEAFHAKGVDQILAQTRVLPGDQRFAALKSWTLPGDDHQSFRLYATFAPAMAARIPFGQFQSQSPFGIQPVDEPMAPALDLISVAKSLGKLDELAADLRTIPAMSGGDERSRQSLLGLIATSKGDVPGAKAALTALTPAKEVGFSRDLSMYERWPEFLLVWHSANVLELRPAAKALAEIMVDSLPNDEAMQKNHHRLLRSLATRDPLSLGVSASPNRQWVQVAPTRAQPSSVGLVPAWSFNGRQVRHLDGLQNDRLYFQSPLRGKFTLDCEFEATVPRESWLIYDSKLAGLELTRDAVSISAGGLDSDWFQVKQHHTTNRLGEWYPARMSVDSSRVRWSASGRTIHETRFSTAADPWLAIQASGSGGIRSLRITGSPQIPAEINLTATAGLEGWSAGMYNVGQNGQDEQEWVRTGAEIVSGQFKQRQGSHCESLLQYHRPILEDGTITYEFYHAPNRVHAHPVLGRTTFLLDPDGVKLHWLTDAQYERTGLPPDNVFVDKQAQRGESLPLKIADWNKLKLIVAGDVLTLELNDRLIYERKIDPTNQRHFGLFHYCGDGQVRVRNVVYRGNWPKALPQIADQELAGDR